MGTLRTVESTVATRLGPRGATLTVDGDEVVCVEVALLDPAEEVEPQAVLDAIHGAGLRSGVATHVAWVDGEPDPDGVWRGRASFHPAAWRPPPVSSAPPRRRRTMTRTSPQR